MATTGNTNTVGFSSATAQHLLIDAGAVYKNYGLENEALLGATSGANEFDVKIKTVDLKANGIKTTVKGLTIVTDIEITLKVNMLEVDTDILKMALCGNVDTTTSTDFDIITGKPNILATDYIDNIALIGRVSGSDKPIVIIIKNALCTDGLSLKLEDNKENTLPLTFNANSDVANPNTLPYEIHYPKIS